MIKVRFDKNAVVFFNKKDGTKVRLALGAYPKASRPELVDIKITDYCAHGCAFCYQGSTVLGKHASWSNLTQIVTQLGKAGVFEVALGGGEPTAHPDLVRILREFCRADIIPNFTTKYPARVRKLWPDIEEYVGAIAYSAETAQDIRAAHVHFEKAGIPPERVNLHYVMGLKRRHAFWDYMLLARRLGYRVTLLGYKTDGRGETQDIVPYDWWVNDLTRMVRLGLCPDVSVDTALAAEYASRMPVAKKLYHTREGAFSMYIDAVNMTFGASSYGGVEMFPFTPEWRSIYAKM